MTDDRDSTTQGDLAPEDARHLEQLQRLEDLSTEDAHAIEQWWWEIEEAEREWHAALSTAAAADSKTQSVSLPTGGAGPRKKIAPHMRAMWRTGSTA
jgi:hypothetical protein